MTNKKARGSRAKTRHSHRHKGKTTVNRVLAQFSEGERVGVKINSSVHSGMPNRRRFNGLSGKVVGKRGKAVLVELMHGNLQKTLVVNPAHLHSLGGKAK